jgi:tRNA A37 threonylcarbamoyladenosine dehydratase
MWFLNFIPDNLLQTVILGILFLGVGLYILGLFINFIPMFYPYKEPIRILATLLIIAGVYGEGSYSTEMSWRSRVAEIQTKVDIAERKSKQVNTVIHTKIVKQKQIVHDKQIVIQKEIQVNEQLINKECKLDPIVIKILNEAAADPFKPLGGTK